MHSFWCIYTNLTSNFLLRHHFHCVLHCCSICWLFASTVLSSYQPGLSLIRKLSPTFELIPHRYQLIRWYCHRQRTKTFRCMVRIVIVIFIQNVQSLKWYVQFWALHWLGISGDISTANERISFPSSTSPRIVILCRRTSHQVSYIVHFVESTRLLRHCAWCTLNIATSSLFFSPRCYHLILRTIHRMVLLKLPHLLQIRLYALRNALKYVPMYRIAHIFYHIHATAAPSVYAI